MSLTSKQIALEIVSPLIGAVFAALIFAVFADRFADGATWSGLNPNGGGPGFLLLIPVAAVSFFLRSQWVRRLSVTGATIVAAIGAAICGGTFVLVAEALADVSVGAVMPLASGVVGSFLVPRIVIAVLNETWTHNEVAMSTQSRA